MMRETDKQRNNRIVEIKEEMQRLADDKDDRIADFYDLMRNDATEAVKQRAIGYIGLMLMRLMKEHGDERVRI